MIPEVQDPSIHAIGRVFNALPCCALLRSAQPLANIELRQGAATFTASGPGKIYTYICCPSSPFGSARIPLPFFLDPGTLRDNGAGSITEALRAGASLELSGAALSTKEAHFVRKQQPAYVGAFATVELALKIRSLTSATDARIYTVEDALDWTARMLGLVGEDAKRDEKGIFDSRRKIFIAGENKDAFVQMWKAQ